MREILLTGVAAIGIAALGCLHRLPCRRSRRQQSPLTTNDIGGVVTGPGGPEAGVWVIAETRDLPVLFIRIVRHRRSGPLRHPRSAKSQLRRGVRGTG